MIVKNISETNYFINKSVQIDLNTIDENDGYVLPSQTLDLSKSLSTIDIMNSDELKQGVFDGYLVFVINDYVLNTLESIELYNSGPSEWSKIYDENSSKSNLYYALASGFMYVKNCLIG